MSPNQEQSIYGGFCNGPRAEGREGALCYTMLYYASTGIIFSLQISFKCTCCLPIKAAVNVCNLSIIKLIFTNDFANA